MRIPIWGSPFSLFFSRRKGWGARGGLENGRVFIGEVVGGWMTCGVGEGAIGMPVLGLGREDDMWGHQEFGSGLVLWVGAWRCGRLVGRSQDDKTKLLAFEGVFSLTSF